MTLSKFEVLDGVKGATQGEVLTVYQVGGDLDGEQLFIGGAHRHQVGEELVFFAQHHGDRVVSYGVGTGSFKINRGSVFGSVKEDLDDLMAVNPQGTQQNNAARHAPSIVEFKAHLRDLLQVPLQVLQKNAAAKVKQRRRGVVQVKGGQTLRDLRMHVKPQVLAPRAAPLTTSSTQQGGE
ncbi:MAG: hypothetical protein GY822_16145 [Deltaproteobacteria bacterium]|nr:hypothetical protein [Deltaproteobacteria bacterium]